MGQGPSCRKDPENGDLLVAVRNGDLGLVEEFVGDDPSVLEQTFGREKSSLLHLAAAEGRNEVLAMLLERFGNPDRLNRHKQTPLMLAAMNGEIGCIKSLLAAGANILMFDGLRGQTCLHYAACYGHLECLQLFLDAAHSSPVANSWGFARFVNIRDGRGSTPLHLAAQQGWSHCLHVLLDRGAIVCASTGGDGYPGSTPLHLAARGGSLDCIRVLLSWGADRVQRDASGRLPYMVAVKYKHERCAALLNPSTAEPLVWPSRLKFISELKPEAKVLLEKALIEANKERERTILKEAAYSLSPPMQLDVEVEGSASEDGEAGLCCICFDQVCTIEVRQCGHQLCAHCILALCCHRKSVHSSISSLDPVCPFCRRNITQLVVAQNRANSDIEAGISSTGPMRLKMSINMSEGSSSFKGLAAIRSLGKIAGHNSSRISAECSEGTDGKSP